MSGGTEWWRHAVIDEIYVRSFQGSHGDGIGDLKGITQRLDHLQQLGVDALWLTPFFPSPSADFGDDVADYCDVAPEYRTLADRDELVAPNCRAAPASTTLAGATLLSWDGLLLASDADIALPASGELTHGAWSVLVASARLSGADLLGTTTVANCAISAISASSTS